MSNKNYNHNQHNHIDNNHQRVNTVHGGEHRNGRKSQYKNNNVAGGDIPNEYVNNEE